MVHHSRRKNLVRVADGFDGVRVFSTMQLTLKGVCYLRAAAQDDGTVMWHRLPDGCGDGGITPDVFPGAVIIGNGGE